MFRLQNLYIAVELDAGGSFTMPTDMRFKPNGLIGYVLHFSPNIHLFGLFVFAMGFIFLFFTQRAHCAICTDRIWGLGRQGYKCINCKLLVHKKCHKLVTVECGRQVIQVRRQSWKTCTILKSNKNNLIKINLCLYWCCSRTQWLEELIQGPLPLNMLTKVH